MTITRVKSAAEARGIYFSGVKEWRNNTIGYAYEVYTGDRFWYADTLTGLYHIIMSYPKIKR